MSEQQSSLGMRALKWLAPLLSGAVLGYLIVRVSTCEPEASSSAPPEQRDTPPPIAQAKLEPAP